MTKNKMLAVGHFIFGYAVMSFCLIGMAMTAYIALRINVFWESPLLLTVSASTVAIMAYRDAAKFYATRCIF